MNLGTVYVDVGGFAKTLKLLNVGTVNERYRIFKSLIDIYIMSNDDK